MNSSLVPKKRSEGSSRIRPKLLLGHRLLLDIEKQRERKRRAFSVVVLESQLLLCATSLNSVGLRLLVSLWAGRQAFISKGRHPCRWVGIFKGEQRR